MCIEKPASWAEFLDVLEAWWHDVTRFVDSEGEDKVTREFGSRSLQIHYFLTEEAPGVSPAPFTRIRRYIESREFARNRFDYRPKPLEVIERETEDLITTVDDLRRQAAKEITEHKQAATTSAADDRDEESSASASDEHKQDDEDVSLDDRGIEILMVLRDHRGRYLSQAEIADAAGTSRKSVRTRLDVFRSHGWTKKKGERGGETITDKGMQRIIKQLRTGDRGH